MSDDDGETMQQRALRDPKTVDMLRRRYFDPFAPMIVVEGVGGVTRDVGDDGRLHALLFPSVTPYRPVDAGLLLHEMGHFVTTRPERSVRDGFGFSMGVPDLGMCAFERAPVRRHSAVVEARAIAWSTIVERDLLGIEPDLFENVSSLSSSNDFFLYEGTTREARLDWVAGLVEDMISDFGTVADFDRLWVERCRMLPALFEAESARMAAHGMEGEVVDVRELFDGEWTATVKLHSHGDTDVYSVELESQDGDATSEEFDDFDAACVWIDGTVEYNSLEDKVEPSARL